MAATNVLALTNIHEAKDTFHTVTRHVYAQVAVVLSQLVHVDNDVAV